LAPQFEALASLRSEGLIRHLGLSTVTAGQLAEAQAIAPVVTVQNMFNVARREDQAMVDVTASQGIAYVPYFPLGGFSPLQSETLTVIAKSLSESPLAVALAWLIHRSPNILPIPGTSSVAHLRANVAAAKLELSDDVLRELNALT
jgi:aryl-alcohol dehydrogenase-like predicted oxidoreductase